MPFSLAYGLESSMSYKDTTLHLNLSYDVVLRYMELLEDDDYTPIEKTGIAFEMFVANDDEVQDIEDRLDCFQIILEEFLGFDLKGENDEVHDDDEGSNKKLYDYTKDAGAIYASFLFDYNIDLMQERGRLHWLEFKMLFENLSNDSKMGQIIGYRGMKIPSVKEAGVKERNRIIKMKRLYRLEDETPGEKRVQNQLAGMFDYLKGKTQK